MRSHLLVCVFAVMTLAVAGAASAAVLLDDDFLGTSLDTGKWTNSVGGSGSPATVLNSIVTMTGGDNYGSCNVYSNSTFGADNTATITMGTVANTGWYGVLLGFYDLGTATGACIRNDQGSGYEFWVSDGTNVSHTVLSSWYAPSAGDQWSITITDSGAEAALGGIVYANSTVGLPGSYSAFMGVYHLGTMGIDRFTVSNVPEPSAIALIITGGIGLLAYAWRKRR